MFFCRLPVFISVTSLCNWERADCSCEFEVVSWDTVVTSWETVVTSWLSTCSLLPQLVTSQSCWVTSYVDCDDVSWTTVISNKLNRTSVTAILELQHIVTHNSMYLTTRPSTKKYSRNSEMRQRSFVTLQETWAVIFSTETSVGSRRQINGDAMFLSPYDLPAVM